MMASTSRSFNVDHCIGVGHGVGVGVGVGRSSKNNNNNNNNDLNCVDAVGGSVLRNPSFENRAYFDLPPPKQKTVDNDNKIS